MQNTYPKLYSFLCELKRTVNRFNKERAVLFEKVNYYDVLLLCERFKENEINYIIDYVFDDIINFICENLRDDLEHFTTDIKEFFLSEITRSRFRTNNLVSLSMIIGKLDNRLKLRLLYDPINILLTWSRTQLGYDFYEKLNTKITLKLESLYYNI